jgi:hypothetical protein
MSRDLQNINGFTNYGTQKMEPVADLRRKVGGAFGSEYVTTMPLFSSNL